MADEDQKQEETQKTKEPEEPKREEASSETPKEEVPAEETKEEKPAEDTKPSVSVSKDLEKIIEQIEKLSVLELSQLVKALEEKFGVSAAPAMVAGAAPAASPGAPEGDSASEQTTFNVVLTESGANKISVIKAVRELVPTLGLKEAKDLVDSPPKPVLEGANKEAANEAKTKLEAAGAKVELK